ncbi:MAG: FHIPEP family type III secretion protein [Cytophagales bacterium]|nr:FHIPEP family type III secretion protein [Rhizobacter sp.]
MSLASYFSSLATPRESVLSRYSDLLLVAGVIAILGLMVLPLPIFVIDVLVAVNLALGVMLLLMAIYIGSPLEFSVFPSVLLISTLFRLSLGIATTRMILLHGDGGHIIATFGKTVAGGNLVVGMVVFLIITVVQFIVIAKGAERVAEVSARFTLDAMPGKQMAIDADLRAGMIDKDEARRKRSDLERESKLHGSLDGAMKFVKGDAIAGIVIIVINLLGGLAIGMMQQGMDFHHAMVKYSILTIGDGMVSQIPALLGAMSAGLIVTRSSDAADKHLGDAMRKQFTAKPRVLLVAGAICWLLAPVPGFPSIIFVVLGTVLVVGGAVLTPVLRRRLENISSPAFEAVIKRMEAAPGAMTTTLPVPKPAVPLLLQVPAAAVPVELTGALTREMEQVLEYFQLSMGLSLPRIAIHPAEGETEWKLLVSEVPVAQGAMPAQHMPQMMGEAVRSTLRRNAGMFMGIQEASVYMALASRDYPDTSKEVLRLMPVQRVADVFRRLVDEEVPLRHVRELLESLAEIGQREKDVPTIVEFARIALKRHLAYRYAPQGGLHAVLVTPELEDVIRRSVQTNAGQQQLALEPTMARNIIDALCASVRTHKAGAIVCAVDVRRYVRKLIEVDLFDTPVLSYHELSPTLKLDVLDRVGPPRPTLLEAA